MQALTDFLPLDETLSVSTVRSNAVAEAQRCEAEWGDEQMSCSDGCPRDGGHLPRPDGPLTVGIDGGYGRDGAEKQRPFAVIVGKSILAFRREAAEDVPSRQGLGFVQTYAQKPKRRLFEVLTSQGVQLHQPRTFLADGGDTVRDLQVYLRPEAEPLLDWFHVSMRLRKSRGTDQGLRDHALIATLLGTVLRVSELLAIDVAQYHARGFVNVLRKGAHMQKFIPIQNPHREVLDPWLEERREGEGPIFLTRSGKRLAGPRPFSSSSVWASRRMPISPRSNTSRCHPMCSGIRSSEK